MGDSTWIVVEVVGGIELTGTTGFGVTSEVTCVVLTSTGKTSTKDKSKGKGDEDADDDIYDFHIASLCMLKPPTLVLSAVLTFSFRTKLASASLVNIMRVNAMIGNSICFFICFLIFMLGGDTEKTK